MSRCVLFWTVSLTELTLMGWNNAHRPRWHWHLVLRKTSDSPLQKHVQLLSACRRIAVLRYNAVLCLLHGAIDPAVAQAHSRTMPDMQPAPRPQPEEMGGGQV